MRKKINAGETTWISLAFILQIQQKILFFYKKGAAAVPRQLLWMGLLGILTQ